MSPRLRLWPALLIPPLAFLTLLAGGYALVPWACDTQRHFPLHVTAVISLAIAMTGIVLAWRDWRSVGVKEPDDSSDALVRDRFVAVLGLLLSSLMTLTTLMIWITTLIVPPCVR